MRASARDGIVTVSYRRGTHGGGANPLILLFRVPTRENTTARHALSTSRTGPHSLVHTHYAQAPLQSTNRPSRRRGRRTPLGRKIAELVTGADPSITRAVCNQAMGRSLADQVIEVGAGFKLEHAVRERRDPAVAAYAAGRRFGPDVKMHGTHERPLVEIRQVPLSETHEIVRRYGALICAIFEQADLYGDNAGRAAGRDIRMGNQRAKRGDVWAYVPKESQGGLAARLDVDVRTLEQMIAVLVHGRVLKAWQPPAYDPKTGVALPRQLRGDTYAYNMYSLVGGLPDALAGHLRRWEGLDRQRAAAESPARIDGAELYEGPSSAERAKLDAEAADAAYRRVMGHDPPRAPS